MDTSVSLGLWIRQRRKRLDLTQEMLAERVGCSVSAIRKIEADERRPSREVAELLAEALAIEAKDRPTFLKVARSELRVERLTTVASVAAPPAAVPPAPQPSVATTPPPLPVPPALFIGRDVELGEVSRLLAQPACRLLTLVGPGGVGKTRLALAVAAKQQGLFAHGIVFVALAALTAPEFIVPTIVNALGFALAGPVEPQKQLLNYLRDKQMLLVLDNLEHLLAGVGLLTDLLAHCASLKLLVTSRERLNLQPEWVFDLQGLPMPPIGATLAAASSCQAQVEEEIERYSAVALFVKNARRMQAGFALAEENQAAVAQICRLVDGMPLGIELAAAWVHVLSCVEIAAEIQRNLDFLAVARRDVPARQRSLRATFAYSWELLSPPEKRVLRQISVFRGGFTREAAKQVAGATLPLLAALVDKSLLRQTEPGRYDLHELVRQYLREQLEQTGESEATQQRHWAYCLGLAEARPEGARSPTPMTDQAVWLNQLEREHDNLRAALTWSLAQQESEATLRLCCALQPFWEVRGHITEGRRWLAQALAQSEQAPVALRAKTLQAAGHLAFEQHDIRAAEKWLEAGLALRSALVDQAEVAVILYTLGRVAWRQDMPSRAHILYDEALALYRAQGNRSGIARVLNGLGLLAMNQNDLENAVTFLEESVALDQALGNQNELARSLFDLGLTTVRMEDGAPRAIAYFEASVARCRELGYPKIAAYAINNLAMLVLHQGDAPRAMRLASESLALCRAAEDRLGISYALVNLGHSAVEQGDLALAGQSFREGLAILEPLDSQGATESMAWLFEGCTRVVSPSDAVRLAALAATLRKRYHFTLPPTARTYLERILATLRTQLDEATFAAAWAEGQTMTLEQAIAVAIAA
ncbi:MAG: tetratricopeptide repeat protein [Caldilineaceae bacterium]